MFEHVFLFCLGLQTTFLTVFRTSGVVRSIEHHRFEYTPVHHHPQYSPQQEAHGGGKETVAKRRRKTKHPPSHAADGDQNLGFFPCHSTLSPAIPRLHDSCFCHSTLSYATLVRQACPFEPTRAFTPNSAPPPPPPYISTATYLSCVTTSTVLRCTDRYRRTRK